MLCKICFSVHCTFIIFTFMHLADAFIQSNFHFIQGYFIAFYEITQVDIWELCGDQKSSIYPYYLVFQPVGFKCYLLEMCLTKHIYGPASIIPVSSQLIWKRS